MSTKNRFVCVYASNLAACIGMNRYKGAHEAMEDMWQKLDASGFRAAFARNARQTKKDALDAALKTNVKVIEAVAGALQADNASSSETVGVTDRVNAIIDEQKLAPETTKLIKEHTQSRVFTKYGSNREDVVYEELRRQGLDIQKNPAFLKKQMGRIGDDVWYLGGKIDAMTKDRTRVVEIKNRVRRLFGTVVEYEHVQLQSYMQLLNVQHASLAECFTPKDLVMQINVMNIDRDDAWWESVIMPKLTKFVTLVLELVDDADAQDLYVQHEDKEAYVTGYLD
jgi:hypothetical protein